MEKVRQIIVSMQGNRMSSVVQEKQEEVHKVHARLDPEMYHALNERAERHDRSLSREIRQCLQWMLKNEMNHPTAR